MQAPVGTFLHKSTYKFTFSSYIIRRVLNYFFWCCNYNKYGIATLDHGINFVPHNNTSDMQDMWGEPDLAA